MDFVLTSQKFKNYSDLYVSCNITQFGQYVIESQNIYHARKDYFFILEDRNPKFVKISPLSYCPSPGAINSNYCWSKYISPIFFYST